MTVLSGGLSDGHLWDTVDVEIVHVGISGKTMVPMLPMTAEDLGGWTDAEGVTHWRPNFPRYCIECVNESLCARWHECQVPTF